MVFPYIDQPGIGCHCTQRLVDADLTDTRLGVTNYCEKARRMLLVRHYFFPSISRIVFVDG